MKFISPKAIFLDLDDTILTFESIKIKCWSMVAEVFSNSLGNASPKDFVSNISKNSDRFWSDEGRNNKWRQNLKGARVEIVTITMKELGIYDENVCKKIAESYSKLRTDSITPIPGAIEAVKFLKNKGIKTALITNGSSKSQREKINRFGLERLFNSILIEGEIGFGKPDKRIYVKGLYELGVTPEETWMIGDNIIWDVTAPQKLGIKGIYVDYKGNGEIDVLSDKPFLTISSLYDIVSYLK